MQCHMRAVKDVWTSVAESHAACLRSAGKVAVALALAGLGMKLYRCHQRKQRRQRWNSVGKDVVVLHQFERGRILPSLSPFALKLETFLRMANIKYIIDTEEPMGSVRRKCPWITINGQELSDSELIIDYLSSHFSVSFGQFSAEQHAMGRAVQVMLDEHTILFVAYKRYVLDNMVNVAKMVSEKYARYIMLWRLFSRRFRYYFWMVGVGRFNEQEVMKFVNREVRALDAILGEKQYLLGDTISEYDAAVFAEVSQLIYGFCPEFEQQMRSNFERLVQYHDRMRAKYWPDW